MGRWRLLVNLVTRALAPTSNLLRCATGAHQPEERLGTPDQDADQGPNWPSGQIGGDQSNISPFDLTL